MSRLRNADKSSRLRWIIALSLVALLAVVWLSGAADFLTLSELKHRQAELQSWTRAHPWQASAIYVGTYATVTALSIPSAMVLTIAGGALFGLLHGTALVSIGSTTGATLAFLAARFLFRQPLRDRFRERLKAFDDGVERDGAFYLLTLRLVPIFPYFMINLLAGLTALRTWTFVWVSMLGMLPTTFAFIYAGTQLARVQSASDVLSPQLLSALVVIGLLPLLLRWLVRWLQARRVSRRNEWRRG
jgi:uncharacterized membrane protein YdjX (TVP38/TMEM64 family)